MSKDTEVARSYSDYIAWARSHGLDDTETTRFHYVYWIIDQITEATSDGSGIIRQVKGEKVRK